MRFIAAILAALVLSLSCLPCADTIAGSERMLSPVAALAASSVPQPPHDHEHGVDLCSPFCVCACCAAFSVVMLPLTLPERIEMPATPVYAAHPACVPVSMPLPVWQPPQLA